ncbi:MAG TPA: peptidylprolyl isomerase [Armatimonadota bacterium]|nr:peptidylprolyl isomerase [Armatimonadota bacterium]
MLPLVWLFVALFIGGIAFTGLNTGGWGRGGGDDNHLLAKIGNQEVSSNHMAQLLGQYETFARGMGVAQQAELPGYAWDQILQEYATAEAARAMGVNASTADAEAEISRQIDQSLEQIGKGSKPEELAEMRETLRARADVEGERRRLLAQRLSEKLSKEARPVEVKVAHILIKTDKLSDAEARRKAEDLARQARAGADFGKLAKQYSQDAATKEQGGERGWVSAQPQPQPMGKDAKPDPEAARMYDPAFTAAALLLRPGGVSDPVKDSEGYHVIKALQERNFQPKVTPDPKDPKKAPDPKKQQEAVEQYRSQVASAIAQGLVSQYRARLEAQVTPESDWLKGYLLEKQLPPASPSSATDKTPTAEDKTRATQEAQQIAGVTAAYAKAMKDNEAAAGAGLAYKLSNLYLRAADDYAKAGQTAQATAQREQALEVLQKWSRRAGDPSMFVLQGETLEKLNRKTDAIQVYQDAISRSGSNAGVLGEIADKLKGLGRNDLAEQARKKQAEVLAKQEAERKAMEAERKKKAPVASGNFSTGSGSSGANAPAANEQPGSGQ